MRPDDVLEDHDLDRALRDLLPPMPRSRAWERWQRDDLLAFIETGVTSSRVARDETGSVAGGEVVPLPDSLESAVHLRRAQRAKPMLLGVAAIFVLVVGLVAVQRNREPAPTQSPGSVASTPTQSPVTEPVVGDDRVDDSGGVTLSPPEAANTPFTPLAFASPPPGFVLRGVEYESSSGGTGLVRYGTDAHSTELWLTVRDNPDWFTHLADLGRETWASAGRTVWSDGELDGCLPDTCSIGVQWDDHAAISLAWVEPNAGTLAPGSDQTSLLALLPTIVIDSSIWQQAESANNASVSDPDASADTSGRLLAPAAGTTVESVNALVAGPAGSSAATVLAPDGSMMNLWLTRNPVPGSVASSVGAQPYGELNVTGTFDAQLGMYNIQHECWSLRIADGGGTGSATWRPVVDEILFAMEPADNWLSIDLPAGWQLLTNTGPGVVREVIVPIEGRDTTVSLLQSSEGGAAYPATLAAYDVEPITFLGGDAWAGSVDFDPVATTVYWFRNGTFSTVTATGMTPTEIEDVLDGWESVTNDEWDARFGPPEPADEYAEGSCPPVTLAVRGSGGGS